MSEPEFDTTISPDTPTIIMKRAQPPVLPEPGDVVEVRQGDQTLGHVLITDVHHGGFSGIASTPAQ